MSKTPWRISLQHFMIAGAIIPAVAALGAGVFGWLAMYVFWIVVVAVAWFGAGWLATRGIAWCLEPLRNWIRRSRRTDAAVSNPQVTSISD
jgi:hypothetical protein